MSAHLPPVPPAGRSKKGPAGPQHQPATEGSPLEHAQPDNLSEQGETANIKQNTTNKGYFHGRRVK